MTNTPSRESKLWQKRVVGLIETIRDIAPPGHPSSFRPDMSTSSRQHQALFKTYVSDLRQAKQWTEGWWQALIATEMQRTPDYEMAVEQVKSRWPLGPAPTKKIITVVRKYWLACARLNQQMDSSEQVPPEIFLLKWLMDSGEGDLAEFLSGLPYWPVGLDQDGHWV